jgi:antitoxin (DNA-binding transcriptional repressor) of toxin-antitoxin stability system
MSKEVTVEELREKLDEIIADIKGGETVTITEDGRSIGTVYSTVPKRGKRFPFRDLKISPLDKPLSVDPVELLIKEREYERSGKKYGL